VAADVWSVTSYNELRRDALAAERWNRLHRTRRRGCPTSWKRFQGAEGPIVAATDYMKVVADQVAPGCPAAWRRWEPMASAER